MIVRLLDLEVSAEHGSAAAGIDHISSANRVRRAVPSHRKLDVVLRELDSINRSFFVHVRPAFSGVIKQHLVKIGSRDLISVIGLGTEPVLEIKFGSPLGTCAKDFAAEFFQETGAQKFFVQFQPAKRFHAKRQQRFTDVKAWEPFALEHDHAPSGVRKQCGGSATSWSAANDSDIVHVNAHRVLMLANCPDFGRDSVLRYPDAAARRRYQFMLTCGRKE